MKKTAYKTILSICVIVSVLFALPFAGNKLFGFFTEKAEASVKIYSGDIQHGDWMCRKMEYKDKGFVAAIYMGEEQDLVVPETIAGIPLIGLADGCLSGASTYTNGQYYNNTVLLKNLRSVTIPSCVTSLGSKLCYYDRGLESVTVNARVSIGAGSFYECTSLKSVHLTGAENAFGSIGENAFYNCESLEEIIIPDSYVSIGDSCFRYCSSLKSVDLHEKLASVGAYAFEGVDKVTFNGENVDLKKNSLAGVKNVVFKESVTLTSNEIFGKDTTFKTKRIVFEKMPVFYNSAYNMLKNAQEIVFIGKPQYEVFTALEEFTCTYDAQTERYTFKKGISPTSYDSLHTANGFVFMGRDGEAYILDYKAENTTRLEIPSSLLGMPVVGIAEEAFINNSSLTVVSIPETVRSIGNKAFYGCSSLKKVIMPSEIDDWGTYSFANSSVAEINIPVTSIIPIGTFSDCKNLKKADIPNGVSFVGKLAFSKCPSLEQVTLPDGLKKIEQEAFSAYGKLSNPESGLKSGKFTKITLPSTLEVLEKGAFAGCSSLEEINIPSSLKKIDEKTFYACESLRVVSFENGLEEIGAYAFCLSGVKNLSLPDTVTSIGEYAFDSTDIEHFRIPAGLSHIPDYMLYGTFLREITIPSTVTDIGRYAFTGTNINDLTIPGNVDTIGEYAFHACDCLRNIVIEEGVTYVGSYAFSQGEPQNHISSVYIPSTMERMGKNVFEDCIIDKFYFNSNNNCFTISYSVISRTVATLHNAVINKFIFGDNVTTIPSCMFFRNGTVEQVIMSNSITTVGENAFYNNETIKNITFSENLVSIGESAFNGCSELVRVDLPESLESLGKSAFKNCASLERVTIPDRITEIKSETFSECTSLCNVALPEGLTEIGSKAFSYCSSLQSITLPDTLVLIGSGAFYCCGLETMTLPELVRTIEANTFKDCTELKSIVLPDNLISIKGNAFSNCEKLETLTLPEGLESFSATALTGANTLEKINYNCASCEFTDMKHLSGDVPYHSPFTSALNLNEIVFGENVKDIPPYICSGITCIDGYYYIPDNVTDIGEYAFAECGITEIDGGENLESIGNGAFCGCNSLETVTFDNSLRLIGDKAFANCNVLAEINIPDSVVNIGAGAFKNCTSLTNVRMSDNVTYIPNEAFNGCVSLSVFDWNSESKLIGRLAFSGCEDLNDFNFVGIEKLYSSSFCNSGVEVVHLGEAKNESDAKLEIIEAQSFMDCNGLKTVAIGGNISAVNSQAFASCENLETALISDNVKKIAEDAFDGCNKLTIVCTENSYAFDYANANGIPVTTFVIAPIPNQVYTGFEIKPAIKVSVSGKQLTENIDYVSTYSNNINVGTAKVKVTGKGEYRVFASTANYAIITKDISLAKISPIADVSYTGKPVTPEIVVTDGANVLKEGTDYQVSCKNNVEAGKATVTVKGIGNYKGEQECEFNIVGQQTMLQKISNALTNVANRLLKIALTLIGIFTKK